MGRKIFVSYKYADSDVFTSLDDCTNRCRTVRDYVTRLEQLLTEGADHIYKGEQEGEDLSDKSDDYIWEHLKDKIYDSSITIVLISPNMRDNKKHDRSQWIPWEIYYSLREDARNGRKSHKNALLAIILPDRRGSYQYYRPKNLFRILEDNICSGYTQVEEWDEFTKRYNKCLAEAETRAEEHEPSCKINRSA